MRHKWKYEKGQGKHEPFNAPSHPRCACMDTLWAGVCVQPQVGRADILTHFSRRTTSSWPRSFGASSPPRQSQAKPLRTEPNQTKANFAGSTTFPRRRHIFAFTITSRGISIGVRIRHRHMVWPPLTPSHSPCHTYTHRVWRMCTCTV